MMSEVGREEDIYRQLADELIRYATALVGPSDASDVVSEAVLAAFRSPNWSTISDPRAYLYRSVLSRARMLARSRRRRFVREAMSAVPGTVEAAVSSIDAQRALRVLSPQQRAVVYLKYWEDLSIEQTATMLDVSQGTVRKQLFRARDQLRRELDGHRSS